MQKVDTNICGRSMRWYEWLLTLILLGLACGVRAESVYKCTGNADAPAYQATPCADGQTAQQIALDAAPPHAPSPEYRTDTPDKHVATHAARTTEPRRSARAGGISYECRVSDGRVFYRHSSCPHTIAADPQAAGTAHGRDRSSGKLTITSREIPRDEACGLIHRAGAIGRGGHEHDEDVSTYDRNLGRDPCR